MLIIQVIVGLVKFLQLLGSGIFSREAHTPVLKSLVEEFDVKAVWSRSESSASILAKSFENCSYSFGDDGLINILDRDDIIAVDIVLPICEIPRIIKLAWKYNKHVISEKPIGQNVAIAKELIEEYNYGPKLKGLFCFVSENWLFHPAFHKAKESLVSINPIRVANWPVQLINSKYAETEWRANPTFRGGFMLDAGIHFVAALRFIFGYVKQVSCLSSSTSPSLPPTSLSALFEFKSGVICTLSITFVCNFKVWEIRDGVGQGAASLSIAGDNGGIIVDRDRIVITSRNMNTKGKKDEIITTDETFSPSRPCLKSVFQTFAKSINRNVNISKGEACVVCDGDNVDSMISLGSPEQSLIDLIILEAMLDSADNKGEGNFI